MTTTESAITRTAELERREDEARMFAESALVGERAVAVMRIVTWCLLGIAFSGSEGTQEGALEQTFTPIGLVHQGLIIAWIVFAIAVLLVLRKVRFTPRRALYWPIGFMLFDFGCFTGLGMTSVYVDSPEVVLATLAILLAFSVARFRGVHVWLGAAMATIGYCLEMGGHHQFDWRNGIVVAASFACLATVVWWANRRVRRMFVEVRQRENLARLLPRQVTERILKSGGRPLQPVQREVTILFSDIRDFTSISERMEPQAVLSLLDSYFARMTAIVKAYDGMVNKFIGDGMLAIWGVPDLQPEHARKAVQAAIDMRRAMVELAEEARGRNEAPLRIGIGIHTGVVAAGMLGGSDQSEYTVIGDAVNLASRIEGLTKSARTDLLVSEATYARCDGAFAGERLGAEPVKGRHETVVVYKIEGRAAESAQVPAPAAELRAGAAG